MRVCREGSRLARAARRATVLPAPTSPVMTPRACSLMHPAVRAAALGVGGAAEDVRDRVPGWPALPAHLDASEVERVEDQLHLAAGQRGVDLVGVAVQRHRGGLADGAALAPQERLVQLAGAGQR